MNFILFSQTTTTNHFVRPYSQKFCLLSHKVITYKEIEHFIKRSDTKQIFRCNTQEIFETKRLSHSDLQPSS